MLCKICRSNSATNLTFSFNFRNQIITRTWKPSVLRVCKRKFHFKDGRMGPDSTRGKDCSKYFALSNKIQRNKEFLQFRRYFQQCLLTKIYSFTAINACAIDSYCQSRTSILIGNMDVLLESWFPDVYPIFHTVTRRVDVQSSSHPDPLRYPTPVMFAFSLYTFHPKG